MQFFKQQKVTCLSHFPEDMSTMQKLVASMIHHPAVIFKVCTCVIFKGQSSLKLFWKRFKDVFPFTLYCFPSLFTLSFTIDSILIKFEQSNVNKWPKWATGYPTRDWALVGKITFFSKSTHMTPPQNFRNKKLDLI